LPCATISDCTVIVPRSIAPSEGTPVFAHWAPQADAGSEGAR
jgi:hypothetical protein